MTHKILLADDSVTIRKVVELTFSDEDFTIVSVGDGAQALERARAERPDIVISDVIMPGLNGYELCQQLKSDPALQSIPFLFLKGTFESFDEQKARACGADGFIVKPFESQEMIARVKELIATGPAAPQPSAIAPQPRAAAPDAVPVAAQPVPPAIPQRPAAPAYPTATPAPVRAPVAPGLAVMPPAVPRPPVLPPLPRPGIGAPVQVAPPAPPAPPARPVAVPPAPPAPPRPERPFTVPAPSAPPAPPPPMVPSVPAPQPREAFTPPPSPLEEFGFDFGETEGARAAVTEQPTAALPAEPSGETDEDLWSEVSLRDRGTDVLEAPAPAAGETMFEETPGESMTPEAEAEAEPGAAAFEEAFAPPAPAAAPPEETFVAPGPSPASLAAAVDQGEIERLVASRVDAAVRQALEPIVNEVARTMVETIAWEVIPDLAEAMIRAEIERIRQSARTD